MATRAQRRARERRRNAQAHAQGYTRRGYEYVQAGGERALAERSTSGIRRQAAREIEGAYQPVAQEFSRREREIQSIDAKRAADEAAFSDWLKGEQARIAGDAQSRYIALSAEAKDYRTELAKQIGTSQTLGSGAGGVQAQPAPDVNQLAKSLLARSAATGITGTERTRVGGDVLGSTLAANLAMLQNLPAKRRADLSAAMSKLAEARGGAAVDKAGALAKLTQSLQDAELTKAQARIGERQFMTKEERARHEFAIQSALSNKRISATVRGQNLAHDDRVAKRAQDDRQRSEDFKLKYGRTPAQWLKMTSGEKKRLKERLGLSEGKGGSGGGGHTPLQKSEARRKWQGWESQARRSGIPKEYLDKSRTNVKVDGLTFVQWLGNAIHADETKGEGILTPVELAILAMKLKYGKLTGRRRKELRDLSGINGW